MPTIDLKGAPIVHAFSHHDELAVFFCTLEGFPNGSAQTNKLGLFARAVLHAGTPSKILILEAFEDVAGTRNTEPRGLFHGIPFEYTPGQTSRAASFLARSYLKVKGLAVALYRMRQADSSKVVVVLFMHDAGRLVFMLVACRLMGLRTVIDLCEWMPAMEHPSMVNRWAYETGMVFRLCDGVISISHFLEARVRKVTSNPPPSFYLSNLIDPTEFEEKNPSPEPERYILWAGLMDQYQPTVQFVLRAFAIIRQSHPEVLLVLCGPVSAKTHAMLLRTLTEEGLSTTSVRFPGFIPRSHLLKYYAGALALLVPLENDERSRARFPFKLGEYLLTGKPVVSTRIGDIPDYLEHGHSAMLAEPDDAKSFAQCVTTLLEDIPLANEIGRAGASVAYKQFDYRIRGPEILHFLKSVVRAGSSQRKALKPRDV